MPVLERAAYMSLISLCLVSGVILVRRNTLHNRVGSSPIMLTERELAGKTLEIPPLQKTSEGDTAVLFISSHCHFCDASMPFYKRLIKIEHQSKPGHIKLVVISREPSRDIEQHLALHQVVADHVYQMPSTFTLLRGTPTLVFVNKSGIIQHAFLGQLNSTKERQVLELFGSEQADLTCQASQECSA